MNKSTDNFKELSRLVDEHRPHEALLRFLEQISDKSFSKLSTSEMVMLDLICQRALPELLEYKTLWMVNHPDRLRRMLQLLMEALKVDYRAASTVDQIAWLRCLLAINQALAGHIEVVHKELCLAGDGRRAESVPNPNGIFQDQVKNIELTERTSTEFLKEFFASYMQFLRW